MMFLWAIVLTVGLVIGSFLNVCIYRIPKEESLAFPPSHCMDCGTKLKARDLIPVFSYLFLKGKCRGCGAKISIRYPLIEILTSVVFGLLFYKYGISVDFVVYALFMSILIAVFFIDVDHMIIPNELVVCGCTGAMGVFIYNLYTNMQIYGDSKWFTPLLGGVIGCSTLLLVDFIGKKAYKVEEAMGMGDIKIIFPIGIFLGWKMTLVALFLTVMTAAIIGVGLIVIQGRNKESKIAFGPFLVMGTFITLLYGWDFLNWWLRSFTI